MHEAMFYRQLEDKSVLCDLCHHHCHLAPGRRGLCGVRENQSGRLISLVYGRLVARNIDPIEKKPLFHFLPASRSYSIATVGCNFRCRHCQNYQISQYPHLHQGRIDGTACGAEEVVAEAVKEGCASISYTYVEPTIFYEFAFDCARLARDRGLKNVFVSNGYLTAEAARKIAPVLDAINIDLKAMSDGFYQRICKAKLAPVLENIRLMVELGMWVEVTTLVIPGLNDSEDELRAIVRFLVSVSKHLPWHVSAFHPAYQLIDRPATPAATLERAREIGLAEGLHYVYVGNVVSSKGEETTCPGCGKVLIRRLGFQSQVVGLRQGHCDACNCRVAGVWA